MYVRTYLPTHKIHTHTQIYIYIYIYIWINTNVHVSRSAKSLNPLELQGVGNSA